MRGAATKAVACLALVALLSTIVSIATARADYLSSEQWFSRKVEEDRVVLQGMLVLLGHYTGYVDAEFGQLTYRALVAYQRSRRLDPDGVLDSTEERDLLIEAASVYEVLGFSTERDERAGIMIPVPINLFARSVPSQWGTRWEAGDDSIELETLAVPEADTSFEALHRRLSGGSDRTVTYSFTRPDRFVLSGFVGERKFYTTFVRQDGTSRGFSISWDSSAEKIGSLVSVFLASMVAFPDGREIERPDGQERGERTVPSSISAGSGFAIAAEGIVLTNAHVVEGCKVIEVTGFGPAILVSADEERDLAVLRLSGGRSFESVARIKVATLRHGQSIIVVGYPLSDILGNAFTVNQGIVSGLSGVGGDSTNFMISANVQPGNSGGPILDMNGDVVGVAVAKLNDIALLNEHGTTSANIGFAINAATLLDFLKPFKVTVSDDPIPADASVERAVAGAKDFTHHILCKT